MRRSICYVASYDPGYARNTDVVRAFAASGITIEVVRGAGASLNAERHVFRMALAFVAMIPLRMIDVALRLLRSRALVVGYFGQLDMLMFAPLAKLLGRPVIFSPLVTLTDTLVEDRQLIAKRSPLAYLVRRIDRLSLRLADVIIVDTVENADYAQQLADIDRDRVVVWPVGVDESIFYPPDRAAQDRDDTLDILFYGKFIPLHGIEVIVEAAALLRASRPDIRFELIGQGQQYATARDLADRLGATNVQWTDWLPYSELGERLRDADIALGIFDSGGKAGRVIPNKVHQALACGTPVITRTSPASERLLAQRESAMLIPPDNPQALAAAIVELADDAALRVSIGRAGRAAWEADASDAAQKRCAAVALRLAGVAQ